MIFFYHGVMTSSLGEVEEDFPKGVHFPGLVRKYDGFSDVG